MLSGRYRSDYMARHWSSKNKQGYCLLCPGKQLPGDLVHLLAICPTLNDKRISIYEFWKKEASENAHIFTLIETMLKATTDDFVQFILDPSVTPEVILGVQEKNFFLDEIFRLTRTFCYAMHRRRLQLLGLFNVN